MRWFVAAVGLGTVLLVAAIVSGWGLGPNETRPLNDLIFFVFFTVLAVGLPGACAIAILRYRLRARPRREENRPVRGRGARADRDLLRVRRPCGAGVHRGQPFAILGSIAIGLLFWPVVRLARRIADRVVYGGARRRTRSSPSSRDASPGPTPPRMCCRGWRGSWSTRWVHARRWSGSTWAPNSGRRGSRPRKSTRRPRSALEAKDSRRSRPPTPRSKSSTRASSSGRCPSRCPRTIR